MVEALITIITMCGDPVYLWTAATDLSLVIGGPIEWARTAEVPSQILDELTRMGAHVTVQEWTEMFGGQCA